MRPYEALCIFSNILQLMLIPLIPNFKTTLPDQFPMNYFAYVVMPLLIVFLFMVVATTNNKICILTCFLKQWTQSTLSYTIYSFLQSLILPAFSKFDLIL